VYKAFISAFFQGQNPFEIYNLPHPVINSVEHSFFLIFTAFTKCNNSGCTGNNLVIPEFIQ